ncbi:MAG TPA: APC family permease [Chthoniobacterales bacterium]|jgi:amino acid transporter|nr:APC family permease [Chthoniobacterales bacterium]
MSIVSWVVSALFGRRLATSESREQEIGVLSGVPVLGLDALSSAAYGPEAALAILIPAGILGLQYLPAITAVILALLAIVYFSYRQTLAAYPNGGGSYIVASVNLGKHAGIAAAASLMLDYLLNVAVGISAGIGALESAIPWLQPHTLAACLVALVLITMVNLRGVRDAGTAFGLPTYAFVATLLIAIGVGVFRSIISGGHPNAIVPLPAVMNPTKAVTFWLLIRSFASGCTAMTGVEAVSNGVPLFAEPRVKRAEWTLTIIVATLGVLLAGIAYLSRAYHIGAMDQQQPGYQSILSQMVSAVLGHGAIYYITIASVLSVLILSANTSFADFPRVCRLLAEDDFLPAGFANRGRRLVYSLGISVLAVFSGVILIIFGGITDRLIPLFAVGAFGAFTLSQAGMVAHWWRKRGPGARVSLLINALGASATAATLVVIIVAKFVEGAWIALIVVPGLIMLFLGIHRHYRRVMREVKCPADLELFGKMPLTVIIPIEGWDRVTARALHLAVQISDDVTAVYVCAAKQSSGGLPTAWNHRVVAPAKEKGIEPPRLKIIVSPYRRFLQPLLDYVQEVKKAKPDRLIAVVIPELVQTHWYEYFLYNQRATLLKVRLFLGGDERIIVINTPWYLREESVRRRGRLEH